MVVISALKTITTRLGGGVVGQPELVTHIRTRVPAAASQMPGAVTVVSVPDR